jgi:alkanesulfonate monooxygenase SsuD/methylene tetrahydromethanopterin reductase-like flavin-dependent oxidoreductase (luciferase family)
MTSRARQLHLGVAIDHLGQHPAAWRQSPGQPGRVFTAEPYVAHTRLAESGLLDFVTLDDSFAQPSDRERTDRIPGRLDALLTLARVAPQSSAIGLIPTIDTTHTEPFSVSKNVATLDWVSLGRAGWRPAVAASDEDYRLFGRKESASPEARYEEASEVVDVVARLWDSWEDDAIIRDRATGRYVDRDKLHYVDFEGRYFSVRGPSITPRSPQGHPLVMVHADHEPANGLAVTGADLVTIDAADGEAAGQRRQSLRNRIAAAGRDPDSVFVFANIEVLLGSSESEAYDEQRRLDGFDIWEPQRDRVRFVGSGNRLAALIQEWFAAGAVDGFVVLPARLPTDLQLLVDDVVPSLQRAGLFRSAYTGSTLRDRFGLTRPSNRYAGIA